MYSIITTTDKHLDLEFIGLNAFCMINAIMGHSYLLAFVMFCFFLSVSGLTIAVRNKKGY